jgi:hypothetical protein
VSFVAKKTFAAGKRKSALIRPIRVIRVAIHVALVHFKIV